MDVASRGVYEEKGISSFPLSTFGSHLSVDAARVCRDPTHKPTDPIQRRAQLNPVKSLITTKVMRKINSQTNIRVIRPTENHEIRLGSLASVPSANMDGEEFSL